jgi:hypothetical protein
MLKPNPPNISKQMIVLFLQNAIEYACVSCIPKAQAIRAEVNSALLRLVEPS